jgi:hypothetical protein
MKDEPPVPDWRQFCRGADGISVDGDSVTVTVHVERQHRIGIRETADTYELTGLVARLAALSAVPDVPLRAWRRNRGMQLVGFRVDHKGRLVGEAWAPKAGLRREEFLTYVRRVAAECDVFEYHLTGKDRE